MNRIETPFSMVSMSWVSHLLPVVIGLEASVGQSGVDWLSLSIAFGCWQVLQAGFARWIQRQDGHKVRRGLGISVLYVMGAFAVAPTALTRSSQGGGSSPGEP